MAACQLGMRVKSNYLDKLRPSQIEHELWQVLQLRLQIEGDRVIFSVVSKARRQPAGNKSQT